MEKSRWDAEVKKFQYLCLMIADLRAIALDSNAFTRISAMKGGTKKQKFNLFDTNILPSQIAEKEQEQKEYEKRRAQMTEEERRAEDVRSFLEGKKYKPRG